MVTRRAEASPVDPDRWAVAVAALQGRPSRRTPLSTERVVETALALVAAEGFDALTMRGVAAALGVTPGALYVHVRDKAELDDLLLGMLCRRVRLPVPDPQRWRAQAHDVLAQLRDLYLRYPGISRAALTAAPRSLDTLRLYEGLLAILLAGAVELQPAAWMIDAAILYVGAYSALAPRRNPGDPTAATDAQSGVAEQFENLPAQFFPIITANAVVVTSGNGHDRFDFMIATMLDALSANPAG